MASLIETYGIPQRRPDGNFVPLGGGNDDGCGRSEGEYADFFCYNQNGFNNALYRTFDDNPDYRQYGHCSPKKQTRAMVENRYPKRYPCFMRVWTYITLQTDRLVADFEYVTKNRQDEKI